MKLEKLNNQKYVKYILLVFFSLNQFYVTIVFNE